jgi:hypothetical protein
MLLVATQKQVLTNYKAYALPHSPVSVKKPKLDRKPARKPLKGKEPTSNM